MGHSRAKIVREIVTGEAVRHGIASRIYPCLKCNATVRIGEAITAVRIPRRERLIWVHPGCAPSNKPPAEPAKSPEPGWKIEPVKWVPDYAAFDKTLKAEIEKQEKAEQQHQKKEEGEPMTPEVTPPSNNSPDLRAATDGLVAALSAAVAATPAIQQELAALAARVEELSAGGPRVIKVEVGDRPPVEIEGVAHPQLEWTVKLAQLRENILLVGPTGSGKTHLARQVAQALGLPFAHLSCSGGLSEGQIYGRLLPTGENGRFCYVESSFVHTYTNGGVFLFDELDAADENVLLALNAALANGHMALPNDPARPSVERHPDAVIIGAANTWGTGADRQYVGRNRLDESTLDRYRAGVVAVDYSPEIEKALCPDKSLRSRLQRIRANLAKHKIERIVSTRFMASAYKLRSTGADETKVMDILTQGWREDEIKRAMEGV